MDASFASALVEHGHLDVARRLALDGDGNCASAVAKALSAKGRREEALEMLAPFAETTWWAARRVSSLLQEWGRTDEAVALIWPRAEAGERDAVEHLARLLHRIGRVDEAVALLRDHVDDWWLAQALVDVTDGQGLDEEVAALLAPHVEVLQRPGAWSFSGWNAVLLLAVVRERQGLVDEAISVLRANIELGTTNTSTLEALADLLARHGQESELQDFIAGRGGDLALFRWAAHLEESGDVEGAIALLRSHAAREAHAPGVSPRVAGHLAYLLDRHGKTDEAIEVLRPIPRRIGYACGCVISHLCYMMVDRDRLDEALEIIADVPYADEAALDLFYLRIEVLKLGGRQEQAITELHAHPGAKWQAEHLADLLADAGRLDDAAVLLAPAIRDSDYALTRLAELKVQQGRLDEALGLLRDTPHEVYPDPCP